MVNDWELRQRFEDCVEQCAESLFRVAFRLCGNRTLANELVQETYLNAWQSIESLKDKSKLRSWIFSILRNQYSKLIRKEARFRSEDKNWDSFKSQENHGISSDTKDEIQAAFDRLDEMHKLPLLLVTMEGMSTLEAAKVLGIPKGTVLSRMHRGKEKLREYLKGSSILVVEENGDG